MAQQLIGLGTAANDGTGDSLRTAGEKTNANFSELYGRPVGIEDAPADGKLYGRQDEAWAEIIAGGGGGTGGGSALPTVFRAVKTSNQAVAGSTIDRVTYENELFDTGGVFANSVFTVPASLDGRYAVIAAGFRLDAPYNAPVSIYLRKNNEYLAQHIAASADNTGGAAVTPGLSISSGVIKLQTGDVFSVEVYGSQPLTVAANTRSFFAAHLVDGGSGTGGGGGVPSAPTSIAVVQAVGSNNDVNALTLPNPVTPGNLLVCQFAVQQTPSPAAGWTALDEQIITSHRTNSAIYYRIAEEGDGASFAPIVNPGFGGSFLTELSSDVANWLEIIGQSYVRIGGGEAYPQIPLVEGDFFSLAAVVARTGSTTITTDPDYLALANTTGDNRTGKLQYKASVIGGQNVSPGATATGYTDIGQMVLFLANATTEQLYLTDAPQDGQSYARKDGAWQSLPDSDWTDLSFTSSETLHGRTVFRSTEVFTLAFGDRLEVEGAIFRQAGTGLAVGSTDGANGHILAVQSDGNVVYYQNAGAGDTAKGASGTSGSPSYTGPLEIQFSVVPQAAASTRLFGSVDFVGVKNTGNTIGGDGNVRVMVETANINKCRLRARVLRG